MHKERNIRLLYWFNFFHDFRPHSAIAIIYFAHVTESYALGLAVYSVSHLASAFFELPTGILSDRIGRKGTIILGSWASVFSLVFYAIGGSFTFLAIGGVFEGFKRALFSGNNNALLYDTLKEQQRENEYPKWLGKTSTMFSLALGSSALIGGFIADWSLSLVMWISVIPQVLTLGIAVLFREPKVHSEEKNTNIFAHLGEAVKRFKENYQLRTLSISSILTFGIREVQHQFTPAFLATLWPLWAVGIAGTITHFAGSVSYWFAGPLIKRFNAFRVLIANHIYSRVLGIIASAYPTPLSPLLVSFQSFAYGSDVVSENSLMQERFTDRQRATMGSLNALGGSIFFAIFAYCLGLFADKLNPASAFLLCELLILPTLLLLWLAYRNKPRGKDKLS